MADASFEDGAERPLRLRAFDADNLSVISALSQDAIFPMTEVTWAKSQRRFAVLLNRFRWEDAPNAQARGRQVERVQTVLAFEDVMAVRSQGVSKADADTVVSLLSIAFHAGEDGTGRVELILSGDGVIALEVEALEATLHDVTRPYLAPTGKTPQHPE